CAKYRSLTGYTFPGFDHW
nr:immunoglobulin heavy chain junction region [Macaca mulatta]MOY22214.1 immunoglobulin heavy chain junction region [Macaca mulatta]MOY24450.1 immunoglobulin heavy chain junction region [Macaca mulatta]MOY24860.1 immunoglobulin heavy chain junction region [Macaca mulatta]MOY25114.1 immunoglobulin heavy chain junction region [Macaca mulatta]